MPIPFPKIHIAESVLNRIFNTMDDMDAAKSVTSPMLPPVPPDPTRLGLQLDEEVSTPLMPAAPPAGLEPSADAGMLESSVQGGSPFDGVLGGIFGAG